MIAGRTPYDDWRDRDRYFVSREQQKQMDADAWNEVACERAAEGIKGLEANEVIVEGGELSLTLFLDCDVELGPDKLEAFARKWREAMK